jgi:periplasmic protein TonB
MLLNTHRPTPVLDVIPNNPTANLIRLSSAGQGAARSANEMSSTFRYFGIPPRSRIPWVALLLSVGIHAVAILGFNGRAIVKKAAVVKDAPSEILMMPEIDDPEEKKPQELSDDEPIAAPAVQVPMLADIPTMVPVNSFTQLIDVTPPLKSDALAGAVIAIPVNIQRGRPDTSKIRDLFNISDLDRRPEPIVQTPPVFPYELKAQVTEARVRLGFIVTSQGDVIMPYVVSSTHRGFERPALDAVLKWKFKPGMRGGRKVNTRVEQPIDFKVTSD